MSSRRARRGWEFLLEGQEELGSPSRKPGGVGRAGRGWEAFLKGADGVSRPSRRARKGQEALLEGGKVWEALLENWEGARGPSGWPGGYKPSQKGWEETAVPHGGRDGLRSPPGGRAGVRRPSWRVERIWESLPESTKGLGGPGEVGSPSRRAGRGQEALPERRER